MVDCESQCGKEGKDLIGRKVSSERKGKVKRLDLEDGRGPAAIVGNSKVAE